MSDLLYYAAGTCWSLAYVALGAAFACALSGRKQSVMPLLVAAVLLAVCVFPLAEVSARTSPSAAGAAR